MIQEGDRVCPLCGGELAYYDRVKRLVLGKDRLRTFIFVNRYFCCKCHSYHREIPRVVFPYKHYETEIINGVLDGFISSETLGFEDYPSEITMDRWRATFTTSNMKRKLYF